MTFLQKMEWAETEWAIRQTEQYDETRWREREKQAGAISNEAGRAIRAYVKIAKPGVP